MMGLVDQMLRAKANAAGVPERLTETLITMPPDLPVPNVPAAGTSLADQVQFLTDQLNALRRDHAKLQQAIFEAAQIQRRLCAPRELDWSNYEVAGEIFPVRHLSGDFFKVLHLDSSLGMVLGDIAGKGLTAGIWQTHLMALIERAARRHSNPAKVVAEVNRELCRDSVERPIMALFYARLDRKNNLVYCNAGLPAPLLVRANDKRLEQLEQGGPMLGALNEAAFQSGTVTMHPGDMVVAYSDGVTECRNIHDLEFETERLACAVTAVSGVCASKALFSLLGTVLDFADSCSPNDDLTLLVIRRRDTITLRSGSRTRDYSAPPGSKLRSRHRKMPSGGDAVPNN
jgi:serine phosphatase RsbU (regulator of sigma subunit)